MIKVHLVSYSHVVGEIKSTDGQTCSWDEGNKMAHAENISVGRPVEERPVGGLKKWDNVIQIDLTLWRNYCEVNDMTSLFPHPQIYLHMRRKTGRSLQSIVY
jgi:uncharacterized Zn-finger protein